MSSKQISLDNLESLYTKLKEEAKTTPKKAMITNIHQACEVISSKAIITIASVVRILVAKGIKITERTIYNDREGGNPYKILTKAWIKHSELVNESSSVKSNRNSIIQQSLMSDHDLSKIDDITLRHKISLLYGEVKGLRNQLNMLREIREMPPLVQHNSIENKQLENQLENNKLEDYDLEVIKALLKESKRNPLSFDENNTLISNRAINRGDKLSLPGLKDVLIKLLN